MARLLGYKAGLLSTVCNYVESTPYHTDHTTPDPLTINEMLRKMADAGCDYCAMEVSSHAAHQHRIAGLHFAGGIFTIVDYAHTPDAVVNVLQAIREVIGQNGEVITVVGAGGNRDKGKRPIMAREAAARSQRVILTSDNPRFEEPEDILADMEEGLDEEARTRTLHITDRRQAIRTAVALARPGTVILIAGKGHEDYQEVKGVKHHFDDREEVKSAFSENN